MTILTVCSYLEDRPLTATGNLKMSFCGTGCRVHKLISHFDGEQVWNGQVHMCMFTDMHTPLELLMLWPFWPCHGDSGPHCPNCEVRIIPLARQWMALLQGPKIHSPRSWSKKCRENERGYWVQSCPVSHTSLLWAVTRGGVFCVNNISIISILIMGVSNGNGLCCCTIGFCVCVCARARVRFMPSYMLHVTLPKEFWQSFH